MLATPQSFSVIWDLARNAELQVQPQSHLQQESLGDLVGGTSECHSESDFLENLRRGLESCDAVAARYLRVFLKTDRQSPSSYYIWLFCFFHSPQFPALYKSG